MTIIALYIALWFLILTSLILAYNMLWFKGLKDSPTLIAETYPRVSICIPARNEADVIERCITSALKQDYPNFEVIVLDDDSDDGTTEILETLSSIIHNLGYIKGKTKPADWLGKPWACHQLSEVATGSILLFIDADVWLEEDVLLKTVAQLQSADAITVWPEQHLGGFWERLVVPNLYFVLTTLLPIQFVEETPNWIPKSVRKKLSPLFAAACGQFIAFNTITYKGIGGHKSVKKQVVEDVELAKNIKKHGARLRMLHGLDSVYCRMYTNHHDLWNGFRKNFLAGFGYNLPLFIGAAVFHLLVFVFPFIALYNGVLTSNYEVITLSCLVVLLILTQRFVVQYKFKWPALFSLLHPVSVLWFQALGLQCIFDRLIQKKPLWKGREV